MNLTTNDIYSSIFQTLPLNIELNESFNKFELEPSATFEERVKKLVPQYKLVLDEFEETIGEDDISMVVDGIGDIITTADGYIGFENKSTGEVISYIEGIVGNDLSLADWSLQGLTDLRDDYNIPLLSVDEVMQASFLECNFYYSSVKSFHDSMNNPKLSNVSKGDGITDIFDSLGANVSELFDDLYEYNMRMRIGAETLSRYLGFCPVKILKEVQASNMSKLCIGRDKAEQTIQKYAKEGLTCLEIQETKTPDLLAVVTTEEVMFRGQLIPKGKFMKGVDYWKPDFSKENLKKFELDK